MVYKIELIPKIELVDMAETEEYLWRFLNALHSNGQILKDYKIFKGEHYVLYVTCPKPDSLDESHNNEYVRKNKARIAELFEWSVTGIGENLESQEYCFCEQRTAMEMQTFRFDVGSVFTCCDCGKPIALYELPFPDGEEEYREIMLWQDNYSAMHMLWVNGLCDRYTGNQLVNLSSALNRQGLALAEDLRRKLDCKVYYNVFDDGSKKVKEITVGTDTVRGCPVCDQPMKSVKFAEDYHRFICDRCSLSSDVNGFM